MWTLLVYLAGVATTPLLAVLVLFALDQWDHRDHRGLFHWFSKTGGGTTMWMLTIGLVVGIAVGGFLGTQITALLIAGDFWGNG